jgi:hypothetical protein
MHPENIVVKFVTDSNRLSVNCKVPHIKKDNEFRIDDLTIDTEFTLSGKTSKDTIIENDVIVSDAKFTISDMWVDGIRIELWALRDIILFVPQYDISQLLYAKQNNTSLNKILNGESTFSNNGKLTIKFDDFYTKYHRNLLSGISSYNHWVVNSHLGFYDPQQLQDLEEIYKNLCNIVKS